MNLVSGLIMSDEQMSVWLPDCSL